MTGFIYCDKPGMFYYELRTMAKLNDWVHVQLCVWNSQRGTSGNVPALPPDPPLHFIF